MWTYRCYQTPEKGDVGGEKNTFGRSEFTAMPFTVAHFLKIASQALLRALNLLFPLPLLQSRRVWKRGQTFWGDIFNSEWGFSILWCVICESCDPSRWNGCRKSRICLPDSHLMNMMNETKRQRGMRGVAQSCERARSRGWSREVGNAWVSPRRDLSLVP